MSTNSTIYVPIWLREILNQVSFNASAELGKRVMPHQVIAAALLTAQANHGEFYNAVKDPAVTAESLTALSAATREE